MVSNSSTFETFYDFIAQTKPPFFKQFFYSSFITDRVMNAKVHASSSIERLFALDLAFVASEISWTHLTHHTSHSVNCSKIRKEENCYLYHEGGHMSIFVRYIFANFHNGFDCLASAHKKMYVALGTNVKC